MKNNKGYYSWIHSMKNAAMQSHFNGQKMLNEATEVEPTTEASLRRAGVDDEGIAIYKQILAQKQEMASRDVKVKPEPGAEGPAKGPMSADVYAMKKSGMDAKPVTDDLTGDGVADAQDVAADARDWRMDHRGGERRRFSKAVMTAAKQDVKYKPSGTNLRTQLNDLIKALEMRETGQHGELSVYHRGLLKAHDEAVRNMSENQAADIAAEYADEMLGAGHGARSMRFESVNQVISRLLNG